eukprot:gene2738-3400_t
MTIWFNIGGFSGALAIGLGAFGAHGLQRRTNDPKKIEIWRTASTFHLIHSVALLLVPFSSTPNLTGALFLGGTILFSGSLYALALLPEKKKLGIITPIGGLGMMAGWAALGLGKFQRP